MKGCISFILSLLVLITLCLANTETILFKIPYYYNIKPHALPYTNPSTNHSIININDTHSLINDYPIRSISSLNIDENLIISIDDYNSGESFERTLLVKVNNYEDHSFESNDFINVKLCWPATYPFDFHLNHLFLKPIDLVGEGDTFSKEDNDNENYFDIYLEVKYKFSGYTFNPSSHSSNQQLQFQLYINKLANKLIPIPNELYGFLTYFIDLLIFMYIILPYIYETIFEDSVTLT
ncbi:hypothetical protein DFJ63DRAFT_313344 [Scheffersomyces coipomensis]|uniref:uncharacterized protein n=1 Tax=Scheffersomyces coipomensis TaxID=1788519 RepID=UPI00315C5F62